jgi:3' terminal RNA ribose 2'-O-methyltransferase Hen1
MLLTLTTTHRPATDLGFLLHKHPERCQEFELPFGSAHVFYPEASEGRCTAALLVDVDPILLARGRGTQSGEHLEPYVNDRPYAASSFLSVAISRVFGSALAGRCDQRPELAAQAIPLQAQVTALPSRGGGEPLIRRLFEPLGYAVEALRHTLDDQVPAWGPSPYFDVTLRSTCRLSELIAHLYVLIPVLDGDKHYWVGPAEVDKLLARGEGWLAAHPERDLITQRYLKHQGRLARLALARLTDSDQPDPDATQEERARSEAALERPLRLNDVRLDQVVRTLMDAGARRVLDLGCGEGRLLSALLRQTQFERAVGVDASLRSLEVAAERLRLAELSPRQRERVDLLHGALTYRDRRLSGFDAAAAVEVIEHLDLPRLAAFERALFACAQPSTVVLTTPNREYNARFVDLPEGRFRHADHRFEWTRAELRTWAERVAREHGYRVRFEDVGSVDLTLGPPTQMAVFTRCA